MSLYYKYKYEFFFILIINHLMILKIKLLNNNWNFGIQTLTFAVLLKKENKINYYTKNETFKLQNKICKQRNSQS